mmetsp:Transcript_26875/g.76250  ORF Transcript_26875/g.76250 Transcript_26875/m.76250 type:complete len:292 (-) Transcript_26875:440-1315(-)
MGALSGLGMDVPEPSPSAAATNFDILPPSGDVSEAMRRWPASVEDFEDEIAWAKETFHESASAAHGGSLGPCKHGGECMRADCKYDHPAVEHMAPRLTVNAQVLVLRRDAKGDYEVLLQRRGHDKKGAGLVAGLGSSKRDEWDRDSRETAIREIIFETGLLDAALLDGAPEAFAKLAKASGARPPLKFEVFRHAAKSDWYVLLLDGEGTFEPGLAAIHSEDIKPVLQELDAGRLAPAHGHAWVPAWSAMHLDQDSTIFALAKRLRQAVFFAIHSDDKHPPSATILIGRLTP